MPPRPGEQGEAASHGQNGSGRKLVRRRDESHSNSRRQTIWIDPVPVYRNRDQLSSGGTQDFPRALIAGIFDGDFVSRFNQHSRNQVESLLGSVDDNHLFGIAHDGARSSEVRTDRTAERNASGGEGVVELSHPGLPCTTGKDAPPSLERKGLNITDSESKVIATRASRLRRHVNGSCSARSGNS